MRCWRSPCDWFVAVLKGFEALIGARCWEKGVFLCGLDAGTVKLWSWLIVQMVGALWLHPLHVQACGACKDSRGSKHLCVMGACANDVGLRAEVLVSVDALI